MKTVVAVAVVANAVDAAAEDGRVVVEAAAGVGVGAAEKRYGCCCYS